MDLQDYKKRLEGLIASSGVSLASLTPRTGFELMLRFYAENPADGVLSCAWGFVNCYGAEELGFSITRWFHPQADDPRLADPISSVSLKFKVGPRDTAGDFAGWMKWCAGPELLADFRSTVESASAFEAWGNSSTVEVALSDEMINSLFDCWGVRDPSRPVVSMTEEEWSRSDDVSLMLRWFRQEWPGAEADLDRLLHRYCLACCRRIWRLLPQERSRAGVEVAERFVDGLATLDELGRADWYAEAAAFTFDYDSDPEAIARWCEEVSQIPAEELAAMIQSPRPGDDLSPRCLLGHAAYFVVTAMYYPGIAPKESIERYRLFLPTPLLREVLGNPFHAE